jgi:toxin HigB-1
MVTLAFIIEWIKRSMVSEITPIASLSARQGYGYCDETKETNERHRNMLYHSGPLAGGMRMRFLIAFICFLAVLTARADDNELQQKIVGSWKLVSVVYEDQDTKQRTPVLGEHPSARGLSDLRAPPANRLEALAGDHRGQHSIRINDQWRICFTWTKEGPANVEIVDYH